MSDSLNQSGFVDQLQKAITEGKLARTDIIHEVSRMSVDEILQLPAEIISTLGADGLSAVAGRHKEFADFAPKLLDPVDDNAGSEPRHRARPINRWARAFGMAIGILCLGVAIDASRPWLIRSFDVGSRPRSTATWPICPRLDQYVDGCLYPIENTGLSLTRAAALLEMASADLAAVNKGLVPSEMDSVPVGNFLVVWRGKLQLKEQVQ